ncbi:MAG TPA: hypothetical protein VF388_08245 [Lacunisphaera sp.]
MAPRPVSSTPTVSPTAPLEQKIRQQAQYIEALISQNEALTARQGAMPSANPAPVDPSPEVPRPILAHVAAAPEPAGEMLLPNADGTIDLTAAAARAQGDELANPFAVRPAGTAAAREVALRISGIIAGKVTCAVINDRLVQANESVESLVVERIEADGVCLRFGGQRLRVPVSEQAVKVRLPL